MEGIDHPDLQVLQGVNVSPLLQTAVGRVMDARHPWEAALPIAKLMALMRTQEKLDPIFQREWKAILGGEFQTWATDPDWQLDLEWSDVLAALSSVADLLDRRGMLYKIQGRDELETDEDVSLMEAADAIASLQEREARPLRGAGRDE